MTEEVEPPSEPPDNRSMRDRSEVLDSKIQSGRSLLVRIDSKERIAGYAETSSPKLIAMHIHDAPQISLSSVASRCLENSHTTRLRADHPLLKETQRSL